MTNKISPNHPQKGSTIKVDPIRNLSDIRRIKTMLSARPQEYAFFTIGINTNLRASDLLRLTIGRVRGLKAGDHVEIRKKKTGKGRKVTFNMACVQAVKGVLVSRPDADGDEPLFKSKKTGEAWSTATASQYVKRWCKDAGLKGNYASHTLRKTWGYHQRTTFGVDVPTLMVCFNHSSQRQTLDYLGIQDAEVQEAFMNEL